jgi:hypothetical protein
MKPIVLQMSWGEQLYSIVLTVPRRRRRWYPELASSTKCTLQVRKIQKMSTLRM